MENLIEKFKRLIEGREKLVGIVGLVLVIFIILAILKSLFFGEAKTQIRISQAGVKVEYLKVATEISKICNSDKSCIKIKIKEIEEISNTLSTKLKR